MTAAALIAAALAADGEGFALRDGDTVVFLGDSITAARSYGKTIENYTLLRFPDRKVKFVNAGWGGDTAAGGLARFDRDVLVHKPTVVTVAYGVNDIGWGMRADAEHKQKYLDAVRSLAKRCKKKGIRMFLCSAAPTAGDPDEAEKSFLKKMCDEGMRIAVEEGAAAIDVQSFMRSIQRRMAEHNKRTKDKKDVASLHAADGVHLNDLGQLAMATAILKGLGAPPEVSSLTIDAANPKSPPLQSGCKAGEIEATSKRVSFVRSDAGRPINFGVFGALQYRWIPIPETFNKYMLAVKGLEPGRYAVSADGRKLGVWTERQLAAGVNLCSATADAWAPGGPWDACATLLQRTTEARHDLALARRERRMYLPEHRNAKEIEEKLELADRRLEDLQREIVRPAPVWFVVERE